MKRLFFLFIFLALSITVSAGVIDLQVKGVNIGASYSTVLRQLGKPLQSKKGGSFPCGDKLLTLRYSGLVIKLDGNGTKQDFSVVSVETTSSKWSVAKGIAIGAKLNDVRAKFGQPDNKTKKASSDNLFYFITDGGANFYFKNNKLVKVIWEENLC
jgi:hypothetical protein